MEDKKRSIHRYHVFSSITNFYGVVYAIILYLTMIYGPGEGYLFTILFAAAGFFWFRYRYSHISKKEEEIYEEKHTPGIWIGISASILFMVFSTEFDGVTIVMEEQGVMTTILVFCLTVGMLMMPLAKEYYRTKFLALYANPAVQMDTVYRFERNQRGAIKHIALGLGIVATVFVVALGVIPQVEYQMEKAKPISVDKQKSDHEQKTNSLEEKEKEEKELPKAETNPWARMIGKVLVILLGSVGAVLILYYAVRFLLSLLSIPLPQFHKMEEKAEKGSLYEEYEALTPRAKDRKNVYSKDANGVIRRMFHDYVKKYASHRIQLSMSPEELMENTEKDYDCRIVELYNKARYSGQLCSEAEVEEAKKKTIG